MDFCTQITQMRQIFTDFAFGKIVLKKSVYISLICVICVLMVHANSNADTVTMTMTLNKFGNVKFSVRGSEPLTIDWDDETIETKRLTPGMITYSHHYSNRSRRTIIIYGQNITHLTCDSCRLTSLHVSDNLALTACEMTLKKTSNTYSSMFNYLE